MHKVFIETGPGVWSEYECECDSNIDHDYGQEVWEDER